MPNEEEIRKIMAKAKKAAGEKGSPHKEAKEKPDSGGEKKKLPLTSHKEEKQKPQAPPPDPQTLALKSSIDRLTDVVGKLEARLTNTETKTEGEETGKTEGATQEELTPEQELAMLQEAQRRAQAGQEGQEGQVPPGPGNPLHIYLLGKTMDMVGKVLPAALMKGKGGSEEGAGASLSQLATEWLTAKIKSDILGEGGGGGGGDQNISVEAMKTMSNFQGMLLGSFFNTIKNLPKPMAERIIESAIETPSATEEPLK